MKPAILLLLPLALAACVAPKPVVSDFNGDSVKVQTNSFVTEKQTVETDAEAMRICKAGGKRRAEYASSRSLPNYVSEHLYLCLA